MVYILWWFWAAAVNWAPGPPWDHDGKQPTHLHSLCAHTVTLLFTFSVSVLSHCSHVWLFATLWTEAHQAPLSMKFSRQDYGSGLPCPPPGHLPDPGVEPESVTLPALAGQLFTMSATWEPHFQFSSVQSLSNIWLFATPCRRPILVQYSRSCIFSTLLYKIDFVLDDFFQLYTNVNVEHL